MDEWYITQAEMATLFGIRININSLSDHSVGHAIVGVRSAVLWWISMQRVPGTERLGHLYTDLSDAFLQAGIYGSGG